VLENRVHPHCFNFFIAFSEMESLGSKFIALAGFCAEIRIVNKGGIYLLA